MRRGKKKKSHWLSYQTLSLVRRKGLLPPRPRPGSAVPRRARRGRCRPHNGSHLTGAGAARQDCGRAGRRHVATSERRGRRGLGGEPRLRAGPRGKERGGGCRVINRHAARPTPGRPGQCPAPATGRPRLPKQSEGVLPNTWANRRRPLSPIPAAVRPAAARWRPS